MKAVPTDEWKPLEDAIPKDVLKGEVQSWAERMGVEPKEVHIRPIKNKWGSCSTNGRLTFDTDLLYQHADFRKRVIVEELVHLRVGNHGKLFKSLLKAYLGQ